MNLFLWICANPFFFFFMFGTLDKKSASEINLCSFYSMSFEMADLVDFFKQMN